MRKKKLIACITMLSILLSSGFSNLGIGLYSYAKEKSSKITSQTKSLDDFNISKKVRKVSEGKLKDTISVNPKEQFEVELRVSESEKENTPKNISNEEIILVIDTSKDTFEKWENKYKPRLKKFISDLFENNDNTNNGGKLDIQGIQFISKDSKLLFDSSSSLSEIMKSIDSMNPNEFKNNEGSTTPLVDTLESGIKRNETKRIIMISDWISDDSVSKEKEFKQNIILDSIKNNDKIPDKSKVKIYPIQLYSKTNTNKFIEDIRDIGNSQIKDIVQKKSIIKSADDLTNVLDKLEKEVSSSSKNLIITDYIDLNKFDYIEKSATIEGSNGKINNSVDNATQTLQWSGELKNSDDIVIKYNIKAKDTAVNTNTINPENKIGNLSDGVNTKNFENISIFVKPSKVNTPKYSLNTMARSTRSLQTYKKAESNGDDTFKITLDVKGQPTVSESKDADIVIMIDKSGSMNDKIDQVKNAAKNFSKNILDSSTKGKVRIAVAKFSCGDREDVQGGSSDILTEFTPDINTINESIDNIDSGGGTHTEDGIWRTTDLLNRSRKDANKYVVFFTDGLPMESYSYPYINVPGDDTAVKDAQRMYYDNFIGYGAPTTVTIGGIGYDPKPETISVNNNPKYKDVKFYSLGLFTNPRYGEKNAAIGFLKTIQNVIEPSKFADKYYTQDLNAIDSIFMDISNDIKADINSTIAKDLVVHDIVTKEFNIVEDSCKVTDLNGKEITIPKENVTISKNQDGCDEITIKFKNVSVGANESEGGVRVSFDVDTKDPYFSGDNIKTNVGADITYKDPITEDESSQKFAEDPAVNIAPKQGSIKITKNVKNDADVIMPDETPFEIVIERVKSPSDPNNIMEYNKTYTLKSTEFNDTGTKHLIGPNTVSADGKLVLSTDAKNKEKYLIAGEYTIKEINVPENYAMQEIKINGTTIKTSSSLLEKVKALFTKENGKATFTLSKDKPSIDIEVVNKSTLTNNLIKNKTATPVLDKNGKPTGEYEIALNVKTPKADYTQYMYDNKNIHYGEYSATGWSKRTVGTSSDDKSYMVTDGSGNHISFDFEGTGFDWIAEGNDGEYTDEAIITIDGVRESIGKRTFSSREGEKIIYSKRNLPLEKHHVTIQHWNKDNSSNNILSIRKFQLYTDSSATSVIKNATITDAVSEYFDIVNNGYGNVKTAVIENREGSTQVDINTSIGTKVIDGKTYDTLTWKTIDIDSNGVTIKFKVKPKDPYHAQDKVNTNAEATVEYVAGNKTNKEYFNKPSVDLETKGKISIKKDVINTENTKDVFKIKISGGKNNETHNIELKDGELKELDVTLKDKNSIVQKPGPKFTIGEYIVEAVSMPKGYVCSDIKIDNKTYPLGKGATFNITKDNPEINIVVKSKVVPELDKTARKVEDGIYEINLVVKSNGININKAKVKDIVSDEFTIMKNQYDIDGKQNTNGKITSVVRNLATDELISLPKNQPIINNNNISWDIGQIPKEGISIKFRIKVKDDYFGGSNIDTNKEAHLQYIDADNKKEDMLFPKPNVDLGYKKGSITIIKELATRSKSDSDKWETVPNNKVNPNDKFSISIVGDEKYTVDLTGNSKQSLEFYLKGKDTDISNNKDISLNYFTEGLYSVEELVPMNYKKVEVYINQTPNDSSPSWVKFSDYVKDKSNIASKKAKDGKLFIGKNNPNISIKVINTLVNDDYFQDKSNVINKFYYNPKNFN